MSEAKLQRLLAKLRVCREQADKALRDDYPGRLGAMEQQMSGVPLIHGTSLNFLNDIWKTQALRSRKELGMAELDHQRCFNTYGAVYVSAGVMYPERQVAIAFSPGVEEDVGLRVDASPWDTGTFYKYVALSMGLKTETDRLRFFREHTLRAPVYRKYLIDYVATCFRSADDYLRRRPYIHPDPGGVMAVRPDDFFLRVFEIRCFPRLSLRTDSIEAVFLPSPRFLTRPLRERVIPEMRRAAIRLEYYGKQPGTGRETNPTPADLLSYVTEWVCRRAMQMRNRP